MEVWQDIRAKDVKSLHAFLHLVLKNNLLDPLKTENDVKDILSFVDNNYFNRHLVVVGAFKTRLQDAKSQVSALKYNKIKLYQHILFNSLFFSLKDRESGPGTSEAKPGRRIGVFHQNAK